MGSSSGSYKVGGGSLSSSSNLSPLAPPFMVNKSNSTNPSLNFPELPVYGTVFDPAGPFSSVGHKFGATEPLGSTSCLPSGAVYGYLGSQSSNLKDAYYVGHNAGAGFDPFPYDQFPHNVSDRDGGDDIVKPYYGPYVSSPPCKDGYLGGGSGSSYDLLSSSGAGHFNGYGSPQVDQTQGVSCGEEYKPKWNGFWSGLGSGEHEKWVEYAPSSGLKDFNPSPLSINKSPLSVDSSCQTHLFGDMSNKSHPFGDASSKGHPFGDTSSNIQTFGDASSKSRPSGNSSSKSHLEDASNKSNLKQGACASQGLESHGVGSTISGNAFDIFGGTYLHLGSFGIHQQGQNLSFKNLAGSSSDGSRMSGFVSGAASTESRGLQRPLLEPRLNFSGSQKADGSSTEDYGGQTGSYMFGCTSTTNSFSNTVTNDTILSINPSSGQDSSYQTEPQISFGVAFQPGVAIRRPVFSSQFGASTQKGEAVNDGLDVKFTSDKTKFLPQLTRQFSSDSCTPKTNDAEVTCSSEKYSSGSDLHNPAEDSPCWKGASSTRFSPFSSVSEAVAANVFVNQEDGCKSPKSAAPQMKKLPIDTSDAMDFSSEKLSARTFPEKPALPTYTSKDHEGFGSGNQKPYCIDLNIPEGLDFLDDCHVLEKDSTILSNGRSGPHSKLSADTVQILEKAEVLSALKIPEASVAAKSGNCMPVVTYHSSAVPSNTGNNSSCSTLGDKSSLKCSQSTKKSPDSKFDVNGWLNTMMKLSKKLHCYCSGNPVALTWQQSKTLNQIINNLIASSNFDMLNTPPPMIFSTQDLDEFPVPDVLNYDGLLAGAYKQAGTAEDFRNFSEDDGNALQDDNMTQAIKKILCDNLHEGIDQPELLYRNLWLEAEAALCVMTSKARFHRMKIEMEKSSHDRVKDKENPLSPKISFDGHGPVALAPEGKDSPARVCDHESQKCSATKQCNDTGDSPVSNSQHLRLNSMKINGPKEPRKEQILPPFSYDTSPFILCNVSHGLGAVNHANDVDNSVMARYQILKSRGDDGSETQNDEGKRCSNDDVLSQDTSCIDTHFSGTTNHAHDVETPVMAGYQILKSRVGDTETLHNEDKQSAGEENYGLPSLETSGNEGTSIKANDVETSVMSRYQILKCRMDNSGSLNEGEQSGGETYLVGGDPLSLDKQFLSPKLFESISSAWDGQASVMARFRIIQNRVSGSNTVNDDPAQVNRPAGEDGSGEQCWAHEKSSFMTDIFGPYLNFSEDEDVKKLGVSVNGEPLTTCYKANKLSTEIFEGWYENDCSTSDWEHVSKEELRRQN